MKRWGIQRKVTVAFLGAVLCLLVLGWALFAGMSFYIAINSAERDLHQTASQISNDLQKKISLQLDAAQTCSQFPSVIAAVRESNEAFSKISPEAMAQAIHEIDSQWSAEPPRIRDALQDILESQAAVDLRSLQHFNRDDVAEIFVTNKYGVLVAATNKTTDYQQADEGWWQLAFRQGKGHPAIGELEYEESAKVHALSVYMPIRSGSEVAGVLKMVVSARGFLDPVTRVKLGKTGEAFLCDHSGRVLFGRGSSYLERRLPTLKLYASGMGVGRLIEGNERKWMVISSVAVSSFPKFGARKGLNEEVRVAAVKELREVLHPYFRIHLAFWGSAAVAYALLIIWGRRLTRRLLSVLGKLEEASRTVPDGKSIEELDIHTHDEVESLSKTIRGLMGEVDDARQHLADSHEDLENLLNAMVDALFVVGFDGKIMRANAAAGDLLGYSPEELKGAPFSRILFESRELELPDFILNQLRQKKISVETTLTLCAKGGKPVTVVCQGAVVNEHGAEMPRAVVTARPAAPRSAPLPDMFVETLRKAIHDINNPLTAVVGYSELLKDSLADEKGRQNAEKIFAEALRCRKMLQDLRAFLIESTKLEKAS